MQSIHDKSLELSAGNMATQTHYFIIPFYTVIPKYIKKLRGHHTSLSYYSTCSILNHFLSKFIPMLATPFIYCSNRMQQVILTQYIPSYAFSKCKGIRLTAFLIFVHISLKSFAAPEAKDEDFGVLQK